MSKPGLRHAVATSCMADSPPLSLAVRGAEGRPEIGIADAEVLRSNFCGRRRGPGVAVGGGGPGEGGRSVLISGMVMGIGGRAGRESLQRFVRHDDQVRDSASSFVPRCVKLTMIGCQ